MIFTRFKTIVKTLHDFTSKASASFTDFLFDHIFTMVMIWLMPLSQLL